MLLSSMAESSLVPLNKEREVPLQLLVNRIGKMQSFVGGTLGVWHSAVAEFFLRASPPLLTDHNCQRRENVEHPCLMADVKGRSSSSILP